MEASEEIAVFLRKARAGDGAAVDRVLPLVYEELKGIARNRLRAEPAGHTLDTTALVHEAYLKLVDQRRADWQDRTHFFAVAARAMRRILIDHARRKTAQKRGGGRRRVSLGSAELAFEERVSDLLELDEALSQLESLNARLCRVVECRYFAGLTEEETASALGLSARTVRRDWVKARAFLHSRLAQE